MASLEVAIMGRGAFGSFLARVLPKHFPQVRPTLFPGRSLERTLRTALANARAVVLAVPIPAYEEVVPRLARAAPAEAVIVDVATVKHATQTLMRRVLGKNPVVAATIILAVISMFCLFGGLLLLFV